MKKLSEQYLELNIRFKLLDDDISAIFKIDEVKQYGQLCELEGKIEYIESEIKESEDIIEKQTFGYDIAKKVTPFFREDLKELQEQLESKFKSFTS